MACWSPRMYLTCSTSALKLCGSLIANSDSIFLFKFMFCCCSPCMSLEYETCTKVYTLFAYLGNLDVSFAL